MKQNLIEMQREAGKKSITMGRNDTEIFIW